MADVKPPRSELDLRDYVGVIRRRKWEVIIITAVVVVLAIGISLAQTRIYEAKATLVLETPVAGSAVGSNTAPDSAVTPAQVETEAEIMRSVPIGRAVKEQLGYAPDVDIETVEETPAVFVVSRNTDPARAAREANDFANTYVKVRQATITAAIDNAIKDVRAQIQNLDGEVAGYKVRIDEIFGQLSSTTDPAKKRLLTTELDRLQALVDPRIVVQRQSELQDKLDTLATKASLVARGDNYTVSGSDVPSSPVSPRPVRNGLIALGIGLLLGLVVAFVRDYFDDTLRTKDDLDLASGGIPVLGLIPAVPGWRDRGTPVLESATHPHSATSEAYRSLRTALEFAAIEHKVGIIHITSSSSGEGKTTTAANLAVALASAGKRVVLVDCDLRRPRVHEFFGIEADMGFTSVLKGEIDLQDAMIPAGNVDGLLVLPSGPPPPNPAELLSSKATQGLLETLAKFVDTVVVDSPPLLPVADSAVLAGYAHATILVVTAKSTTRRALHRSLEMLAQVNAPLEGILFNGVGREASYGYGYGYNYYGNDEHQRMGNKLRTSLKRTTDEA
ncbi:MAG: polysaccharide biosynthesis tyrosine autokinase [Actinobacteria bacterium]|nr:polysaccharide biosynthesis tyrosine autokinase [Actinomycetota bacterium]